MIFPHLHPETTIKGRDGAVLPPRGDMPPAAIVGGLLITRPKGLSG